MTTLRATCLRRLARIIHHVFGEIALLLVAARDRIAALDIAILTAGNIFGRARRDLAAGATEGVVILIQGRGVGRRLIVPRAGSERERGQRQSYRKLRKSRPHAKSRFIAGIYRAELWDL